MDAALASTYAAAELGAKTAELRIGTLPALLRKAAVCQCSRVRGSGEQLRLWGAPHPIPWHVTFSQEQRRQRPVLLSRRAVLSSVMDKFW